MKNVSAQTHTALLQTVEEITQSHRDRGFFPSAVVSVFTPEQTLFRLAAGDVSERTVYDVASLTKIATATQILQLVEAGQLALADEILGLLPVLSTIPPLPERLAGVTVQRLLTHTAGLVDWYPFYTAKDKPFAQVLGMALEKYGPESGMVYSDLGFMLLGKVIEARTGLSLDAALAQNLAGALAPGRITYAPDPAWDIAPSCYGNPLEEEMCRTRGFVYGGWRQHSPVRGQVNDGNAHYYFDGIAGSAGIFADVAAYERLGQMHLRTQSPVLLDAQLEHAPTRGLGWQLGEMYPQGCGHTGFTGTSLYISRPLGIGVVAFTNRLFYPHENPNPTNPFRAALHKAVADILSV